MPTREEQLATLALTPTATDIAIASEVILEAIGDGYQGTATLFDSVARRLADEPLRVSSARTLSSFASAQTRRGRRL